MLVFETEGILGYNLDDRGHTVDNLVQLLLMQIKVAQLSSLGHISNDRGTVSDGPERE